MKHIAVLFDRHGLARALPAWRALGERARIDFVADALSREELLRRLAASNMICVLQQVCAFDAGIINALPNLEMIATTANPEHIDVEACANKGVVVVHAQPRRNLVARAQISATAELTLGLMIAVARRIPQNHAALRAGVWQEGIGFRLAGKTLGLVGLGRVGREVAALAKAFAMHVQAWSANLSKAEAQTVGARLVTKAELFATSDVISVHYKLSPRSQGLVSAADFQVMKPSAIFINTSRGALIDEQALLAALSQQRIAGAGLDVFNTEPLPADHLLLGLANIVTTPHLGYVVDDAVEALFGTLASAVDAYLGSTDGSGPAAGA